MRNGPAPIAPQARTTSQGGVKRPLGRVIVSLSGTGINGVRQSVSDETGRFVMVDVAPIGPVKRAVTLAEMKADPRLADLALIRQSRLSVVPVSDAHWAIIAELAGV
mgnify:CR=1 FL=1